MQLISASCRSSLSLFPFSRSRITDIHHFLSLSFQIMAGGRGQNGSEDRFQLLKRGAEAINDAANQSAFLNADRKVESQFELANEKLLP
jgi:hypothetical protein